MLDNYIYLSTYLFIAMGIALIIIFAPLLVILHFSYKKHLDPNYFNEKHFSFYELGIFQSFPLVYLKILTYIRAIVLPGTMRRRFSENILSIKDQPALYMLSLIAMIILGYCALVLINMVALAVVYYTYY